MVICKLTDIVTIFYNVSRFIDLWYDTFIISLMIHNIW